MAFKVYPGRVYGTTDTVAPARGYHDDKTAVLARLKPIEGQIRGLQRMVTASRR